MRLAGLGRGPSESESLRRLVTARPYPCHTCADVIPASMSVHRHRWRCVAVPLHDERMPSVCIMKRHPTPAMPPRLTLVLRGLRQAIAICSRALLEVALFNICNALSRSPALQGATSSHAAVCRYRAVDQGRKEWRCDATRLGPGAAERVSAVPCSHAGSPDPLVAATAWASRQHCLAGHCRRPRSTIEGDNLESRVVHQRQRSPSPTRVCLGFCPMQAGWCAVLEQAPFAFQPTTIATVAAAVVKSWG
mmetsp:Transcript_19883/g.62964  ORF Transcript_19883/g.62964 Transcript_19883/m.62964 type:complete len:249 (+) Transcript_19883:61-807(+)